MKKQRIIWPIRPVVKIHGKNRGYNRARQKAIARNERL